MSANTNRSFIHDPMHERAVRYLRHPVAFVDSDAPSFTDEAGGVWYGCVALDTNNKNGKRSRWIELSRTPFRTNTSREERVSGWLGNSNGIDRQAFGRVRATVRTDAELRFRSISN